MVQDSVKRSDGEGQGESERLRRGPASKTAREHLCPHCGATSPRAKERLCPHCGATSPRVEERLCPHCGVAAPAGDDESAAL
ncbi:zinc ribbon domain-containing protein [Segniliparus rotundus]|uniref:zinc ribbon domain-containing protein n=1 Tax=Segniliparus rotundus TaxID=286802 RepID=UPI0011D17763|nr:zinc ribbon domain-containing protein [Segniliparus rotundus]